MDVIERQECDTFKQAKEISDKIKKERFDKPGASFHISIKKKENGKYLLIIEGEKGI